MNTFATVFEELARVEERQALVLRLLQRKVGPLAGELQARVAALSPELLLELSEALLDFTSVDDLTAWLDAQSAAGHG